jgi:hypothetical protein
MYLQVKEKFRRRGHYTLNLRFQFWLSRELEGFYISSYHTKDGETKWGFLFNVMSEVSYLWSCLEDVWNEAISICCMSQQTWELLASTCFVFHLHTSPAYWPMISVAFHCIIDLSLLNVTLKHILVSYRCFTVLLNINDWRFSCQILLIWAAGIGFMMFIAKQVAFQSVAKLQDNAGKQVGSDFS